MVDPNTRQNVAEQSANRLKATKANIEADVTTFGKQILDVTLTHEQLVAQLNRLERRMLYRLENINLISADKRDFQEFVNMKQAICSAFRQYLSDHKL